MKSADLNEDPMQEYAHTQDPMLLHPIPVRPKTLLILSGACVAFVAIVTVLALVLPDLR